MLILRPPVSPITMLPVRSIAARSSRQRLARPILSQIPRQRCYASAATPQPEPVPRLLTGNPEIDDPGMVPTPLSNLPSDVISPDVR